MTIFIDENIPMLAKMLEGCSDVVNFNGRLLESRQLIDLNCEILFVRSTTKVNEKLLDGTNVRFVGTATSGFDHVDTNWLEKQGIEFASAPGSNANSVAEYVVFSILKWSKIKGFTPENKNIGIIGYGNIGTIVAVYALNLGMNVFVNDPPLKDSGFVFPDKLNYLELDDIFQRCNVITNHVPLDKIGKYATENLIFEKQISAINKGSLLIHSSRGGVVDEKPLLERLERNELFAAIDVWDGEPLFNPELARLAILCSPHVAGYSRDGKLRGTMKMAQEFEKFTGLKPDYTVIEPELNEYKPIDIAKFRDYDALFYLLQEKRDFEGDTKRLFEIASLQGNEMKEAFDKLRKEYPIRRESL